MLQVKKVQLTNPQTKEKGFTFRQVNVMGLSEKHVAKNIAQGGTYSEGETSGVLKDFANHLVQLLSNNNKVNIEGLGLFEVSTKSGWTANKEDLKKSNIRLDINFTPAAEVLDTLNKAEIKVVTTATTEVIDEDTDDSTTPGGNGSGGSEMD